MKKISLSTKVFIGFIIGILLGVVMGEKALMLQPIGDVFLSLIKMIVVPLIFCSITVGVCSIGDIQKLKKIGGKTLAYFLVTTLLAGGIGLAVAHIIQPGVGFYMENIQASAQYEAATVPSLSQTLVTMVPDNIFTSLSTGNLMQIIVFAIFLGVTITILGTKTEPLKNFFEAGSEAMYKLTAIVMETSPYGVAALLAASVGEYGLEVFGPLAKFILTDYAGMIAVLLIMYTFMLKFIAKVPLGKFIKEISKVWLVTASTTSSAGSLPVTLDITKNRLGVSEELATFTLPIGATMNMNGAVVYLAAAILFVSQIYGIEMTIAQQAMIILMTTLVSVGAPGIPGGGIVMTIMLLTTMGLPIDIVGLIAGMYRIIDMGHTTLNVTGDVVSTLCIARKENMIDDEILRSA